ncbi:MAG: VanW family protein [Coprobacillaceae bacterium]
MQRKLFCEINETTYKISALKCRAVRKIKDFSNSDKIAKEKTENDLPYRIYKHNSLIRRKLGNVDIQLQENKAINLSLATPKVNKVIIKPKEVFSFWSLVGICNESKGYKTGLTISGNQSSKGIGGGLCQFTNLLHWMILHTDLDIIEHHHHEGLDLFPDYGRQKPFGTGTSIVYNYLDYRFKNNTDNTYQIIVYTDEKYLKGEIRAEKQQNTKYHIKVEDEHFSKEKGIVYRNGNVYRSAIDKKTGKVIKRELIKQNHARVMYDTSNLEVVVK